METWHIYRQERELRAHLVCRMCCMGAYRSPCVVPGWNQEGGARQGVGCSTQALLLAPMNCKVSGPRSTEQEGRAIKARTVALREGGISSWRVGAGSVVTQGYSCSSSATSWLHVFPWCRGCVFSRGAGWFTPCKEQSCMVPLCFPHLAVSSFQGPLLRLGGEEGRSELRRAAGPEIPRPGVCYTLHVNALNALRAVSAQSEALGRWEAFSGRWGGTDEA